MMRTPSSARKLDCIRWDTVVVAHTVTKEGIDLELRHVDGSTSIERGFHLLVAGDGRYSAIRSRALGTPETKFGDICNFRILVPNTQPDGTPWPAEVGSGLFDDLQLIYNATPTVDSLDATSNLREDQVFKDVVLRSTPRVGIMRIPASKFKTEVGESLYLFGNFAIPCRQEVPPGAKTSEAMHCMFTPAEGERALTPEGRFIRETLTKNADKLHWSRFQDIPVQYSDESRHILLLGDAAHSFCPSLGQGATTSIEDACVAATTLIAAVRHAEESGSGCFGTVAAVREAVSKIGELRAERVSFIRDISTEAGQHMHFLDGDADGRGTLVQDALAWTDDSHLSGWRTKIKKAWLEYPKLRASRCWHVFNES